MPALTTLALALFASLAASVSAAPNKAVFGASQTLTQALDSLNIPPRKEPSRFDTKYESRYDDQFYSTLEKLAPFVEDEEAECPFELPTFDCKVETATPRNNGGVRNVRPQDIAAIMALGDSVTAGFAMKSGKLPTIPVEYRGAVYSTGGDSNIPSLFNFFKRYNPDIVGASTGTSSAGSSGSELNRAVTGAVVQDLPKQISSLKTQLESSKYKAIKDLPKLLVLFIGPNNLCGACTSDSSNTPDAYESSLRSALLQIKSDIPNTFVALVGTFNISQVWDASRSSTYCKSAFSLLGICGCAGSNANNRIAMDSVGVEYNKRSQKVANEIEALQDPNFQVTFLPSLVDQSITDFGQGILSNWDCFHPNTCGNYAFAFSLFNGLFEPKSRKQTRYDPDNFPLYCPTANDFMQ